MPAVSNERSLRIGEFAAEFDLNPKTIRYYEEIGLLPEPNRSPAGYRLYGEVDCQRLRFILKAKAIGLSLEEIGEILTVRDRGETPCEHVRALLDSKIAEVDQQRKALLDFRRDLVALRKRVGETEPSDGAICGIIEEHEPARPHDLTPGLVRMPRPLHSGSRGG